MGCTVSSSVDRGGGESGFGASTARDVKSDASFPQSPIRVALVGPLAKEHLLRQFESMKTPSIVGVARKPPRFES